jgi:hypothetical protein
MAISAHFRHRGFTPDKYDQAIRRLDESGEGHPAGRLYHVAVEADGEIEVFDLWESREALEKWGPDGFIPVLVDLGVELNPPAIHPVRNVIVG